MLALFSCYCFLWCLDSRCLLNWGKTEIKAHAGGWVRLLEDIRLDKRDIPIPGKYLDSKCMLDQMDVFYTCFGIQAPFCAAHQSCGLPLGPGYLLPLSRAGMMLTEGVSHFSERKGEDLVAGHDPLLPATCVFSIMVKKKQTWSIAELLCMWEQEYL